MRTRGTAQELERRRRSAVQRVQEGHTQVQVAQILGVHDRTLRQWMAQYRQGGDQGLAAKPHPGRRSKLTPARQRTVLGWLRKNPKSFGFATELWTARRIAQVIERKFGVYYNHRYLNAWLTARDISPQKPQRRPRERDDQAIQEWVSVQWPRIQNARAAWGPIYY
jgi:transposase